MSENLSQETVFSMLREIKSIAMQSSLTGGLSKGSRILIDVYNRCLASIGEEDPNAQKLFSPLPTESEAVSMDEIGTAAALLSSYLKPKAKSNEKDFDGFSPFNF
ncbi:hypothetical protein ACFO4N_12605 [Camelliibacillus cellulosilyticus]|uniref:Uncharacterized protein n=1 Tax=Camelliibacillus cellulosilyticus TaxID=2174486 RepID=A0ABV9GPN6_9BACL